jgi:hypothetical protein
MALTLRETDFIGWYREGMVAGAVLTQLAEIPGANAADRVRQRVTDGLFKSLPPDVIERCQARIYQLPAQAGALDEIRS